MEPPYPSLAQGPTPAERLAKVLERAQERGLEPMTEEEFDRYLREFKDLWPDEEIDAFLDWLYGSWREERY